MQKINKPWYKKWWGILIIILSVLFLAILVAFGFAIFNEVKRLKNNPLSASITYSGQLQEKVEGKKNYWIGSASPKITIVEFGDYACPICKKAFPKIREVSVKYKDNVKIIFRDYPVITNYSANLALAARCAGEQGLFWVMHDKLFINQGVSSDEDIMELANQIGADTDRFNNCFNNRKLIPDIQNDYQDGEDLGVNGTPTWFINGNKVEGDIPYNTLIDLIENLIKL